MSSVPQLTATNYYVWAMKLEAVLSLKKVKYVLTTSRPTGDREREKWDGDNDDVVSIIKLTLSDDQAMQFADETNAKDLWAKIKETYVGRLEDSKIDATVELRSISMGDKETGAEYVARARGLASKCKALGVNISDRELVYYVVRGLNGKFNRIRNTLKTQRDKKLDDILEDLREEERELINQKKSNDAAYTARGGKHNAGKKCYVCKKPGHLAKTCWHRKSNDNDGEKKDRQQYRGRGNQRSDTQRPSRPQQNRQDERKDKSEKANEATDDYAFEAYDEDCISDSRKVSWILDSGCSSHMIKEKYVLNVFNHISGDVFLAGKGNITKSEGISSINSKFEIDNKYGNNVYLKDTLFVPELRSNLLSIRKLDEMGYKVVFGNDLALIYDDSKTIVGKGIKNGSKYIIESEIVLDTCFESIENKKNVSNAMLWHKRLAHLNSKYIDRLIKESLVENATKICKGEIECESCSVSKLTQKPHKIVEYEITSKPLELVYIDLCGPVTTDSIKGSKYMMVIVDDYTGMYFVYFLKHKSESLDYFIEFQKKFENRLETKIKSIRTDNGREFINENFRKHLNESGIGHQKTVPYNPQSNGRVERANRVLLDRARTMLNDSKLPPKFWAEAVATACHVSNLTPRKEKTNTPFELFFGRKPSLEHLRVFGCVAFFYVPKQQRDKLEPRGKIGIMVGYARSRSGYRIYDIKNKKIIEERTVKFHENTMGSDYSSKELPKEKLKAIDFESLVEKINDGLVDTSLENENEISEINVDVESNNESDTTDDENNFFQNRNVNENRRGRSKGTTKAVMQVRSYEEQRNREEELLEQGVRRSKRIAGMNNGNFSVHNVNDPEANETNDKVIPNNFKEAKESKEWLNWHKAMKDELKSLHSHNVWEIVDRPQNIKIVKSKWVYTVKDDPENKTERFKARLVAAGFNQIKYRDYEESYSPVVNIEAWRTLLSIAAKQNMRVRFFNIKTAYLYGSIQETVYMEPPPGFEEIIGPNKVCRLQKSIYGLPQSGRNWFERLRKELLNLGLKQLASDNCIFVYNKGNTFICVSTYVDDLSVIDNNSKAGNVFIEKLSKAFEFNETTNKGTFLGMEIEQSEKEIIISQEGYIKTLLKKYGMLDCKPVATPMVPGQDKEPDSSDDVIESKGYQGIIGELLYLSTRTRPDITFATTYLSQFNIRPEKRHYMMAKRILRYLSGTLNYKLHYDREQGKLNGSSDASWGNGVKMKSFSGGVIQLGKALIMWNCRKQKCVADSTCEAELFAINDVTKNVKWLIGLLFELGFENLYQLPVCIASDSQSAIDVLKDAKLSRRLRHVLLKSQFVKDEVAENRIHVFYINTDLMKADFLTKAMIKEKLVWSCKELNLY